MTRFVGEALSVRRRGAPHGGCLAAARAEQADFRKARAGSGFDSRCFASERVSCAASAAPFLKAIPH